MPHFLTSCQEKTGSPPNDVLNSSQRQLIPGRISPAVSVIVGARKSAQKLRSYLASDPTAIFRQPAIDFFRACRCFDPQKAATMRFQLEFVTHNILWFDEDDKAVVDLKLYLQKAGELIPSKNPVEFWNIVSSQFPRLPEIALICLSVPVNSVTAERSFSMYSNVLRAAS